MTCSNVSKAVFVDTNLGTRMVVPVSPDITANEFKGEVERVHLICFPEVGNIRVKGLMVKKKSCYYHLSGSFPLKYAFWGSNATWFLHVDAIRTASQISSSGADRLNCKSAEDVTDPVSLNSFSTRIYRKRVKCRRKRHNLQKLLRVRALVSKHFRLVSLLKRRIKPKRVNNNCKFGRLCNTESGGEANWSRERDSRMVAKTVTETVSETASISGIIKKYFSDYDEVASSPCSPFAAVRNKHKELRNDLTGPNLRVSRSVWPNKSTSEALRQKSKKPEVGRRLLLASESLGLTPSYKQPAVSLCKSPVYKSSAIVRSLVFELTSEGD